MKYNKKTGLRLTQCVQIDTSNTSMNNNDLDFSAGANIPQFSTRVIHFFSDSDVMYSQSFDPEELENQQVEEFNSKQTAENSVGLLIE